MAYLLGLEGSYRGKKYCFKKRFSLGNEKNCSLFLCCDPKKFPFHLEIYKKGRLFFFNKRPLSLFFSINGEEANQGQLFHGNILCIEKFRFLFSTLDCSNTLYEGKSENPPPASHENQADPLLLMYQASNLFASQGEFSTFFRQMAKFLLQHFPCSQVIFFLEETPGNFQRFAFPENQKIWDSNLIPKEIPPNVFSLLYKEKKSIYWKSLYQKGFQYFMAVPFCHQNKTLGFVCLLFDSGAMSQKCDLNLLSGICLQAANSIANMQKNRERKEFNRRLENLNKITLRLSCLLEKEAICHETLRGVCNILQCQKTALFQFHDENTLDFQYSIGLKKESLPKTLLDRIASMLSKEESFFAENPSCEESPSFILANIVQADHPYPKNIAVLYAADPINQAFFSTQDKEILAIIASQTSIALSHSHLYEQATIDYLTKIHLRGYFLEKLEQEIQNFRPHKGCFSILMLDLDHFKKINDQYGHTVGDQTLKQTAAILKNSIREKDMLARYGGEEFIILLKEADLSCASQVAERIRSNMENASFPFCRKVTISIGVAEYTPSQSSENFILQADKALYQAKEQGRNRVCLSIMPPI
ncbi:MAG: sensor domain-containing diguanylate cyclase [Candidatus Brocadiae bacterium]|nr:sensor domain-containing diguanylate cyclase [Candidatus Brocadiia bacterium]